MSLLNNNFITFDGQPVTGRVPTQIVVDGPPLTREQYSAVAHAYKLFCDVKNVSLGGFLDSHRILADGTRVQMTSINGVDTVRVVTQPKNPPLALESIFLSVPCNNGGPDAAVDPRFSKLWKFRNQTDVPHALKASRKITDASGIEQHPGNLTWWSDGIKANRKPVIVSWYGKATRYGTLDYYGRGAQMGSISKQDALYGSLFDPRTHWYDAYKPAVWTNGVKHKVQQIVDSSPVDVPVLSAGLRKVGSALYLYLVTHTAGELRVCRGPIDPYQPSAVSVEDVYAVGFTIDPTLTSGTYWQTLMQPLYFNASCNACAGLISTSDGHVRTMVVDIDGATTTTDGSLLAETETLVILSETGTYPDFTGSPDDIVAAGTHQYSDTVIEQFYGAVDYVGDTLTIAIMELSFQFIYDGSGSYEFHTMAPGSLFHERSTTANFSYRVFIYGTATVLASKTPGPVAIDTMRFQNGDTADTGSGFYSMDLSVPVLAFATIEGGDLRSGCVVVCEYIEVGSSSAACTFENASGDSIAANWTPYAYYPHSGIPFADDALIWLTRTVSAGRQNNLRLAVWKSNVQFDTGPYSMVLPSSSNIFSNFLQTSLNPGSVGNPFSPLWQGVIPFSRGGSGFDPTLPLSADFDVGIPYVNTCAFTPDDMFGFYNVGSGFGPFGVSVTQAYVGAFLFSGTKIAEDQTAFVPGAVNQSLSLLASPIFLDNVPTP